MSPPNHILLMGVGPLPPEAPARLFAPGLRVWAFAEGLAGRGHRVTVLEGGFGDSTEGAGEFERLAPFDSAPEVEVWRGPVNPDAVAAFARELNAREAFDAVVATTDVMCVAAARGDWACPVWMDFFGHPMAERQMLARLHDSDAGLMDQWRFVAEALLKGDRFSACSAPQRRALLGELALCGRLGPGTDGDSLVSTVRQPIPSLDLTPDGPAARGRVTPDDAFMVLWTGGYNTWTDVDTLYEGLILAMAQAPDLHYVSTGGAIAGHDDKTFERFRSRIDSSPFRERFHLVGWVPLGDVKNYYAEADVAVNIDTDSVEGRLGTRNRIVEWILAGTPVTTTLLSEIGRDLNCENAIEPFAFGDAKGLAEAFLRLRKDRARGRAQNHRARAYLDRYYRPEQALAPLLSWAEAPGLPPPAERRGRVDDIARILHESACPAGQGRLSFLARVLGFSGRFLRRFGR